MQLTHTDPIWSTHLKNQRGITIHFVDGSKMQLEFPPQAENVYGSLIKLKEVQKERMLVFEVDGALLMMPFENIKYLQLHPVPTDKLPSSVITGARVVE